MNITFNLCIVLSNILFILLYGYYLFKNNAFKMNAEPLTHQDLFKAALTIPIVSFLLLGYVVWRGHNIQIDVEGFNNFLTISKLPLAALSLSIPLGVIVNNIHRTIQTDKQIKEAEKKNLVDGFYSHRKNTVEVIQNIELKSIYLLGNKHQLEFRNSYSCYKVFYPSASSSGFNFEISQMFIASLMNSWIELGDLLEKREFNDLLTYYNHINKIEKCLIRLNSICLFKEFENHCIYSRSFIAADGHTYEFRSLIKSEQHLKWTVSAYWNAFLSIMELLEAKYTEELINGTDEILPYILGDEKRFMFWAEEYAYNATQPQVIKRA